MEEKTLTFAERTQLKMELTINQPLSFSQICDLEKVKKQIKILWQENKELFDYLEKARIYCLLIEKPAIWEKWWKANQFKIGFKVLNEFFKTLKYRLCEFCESPFSQGRPDKKYCSHNCRIYDRRKKEREKLVA